MLRRIFAIARKEFLEAFSTPLLFVLETIFIILSGYFFFMGVSYYSEVSRAWIENPSLQEEALNLTAFLLPPLFSNFAMLLLFFVPFITMSSFASERRGGTLELLFTFPIRDTEIIFGKWLGTSSLTFLLLLPLWISPICFLAVGCPLNMSTFASGFLGLLLLASLFIACGLFASSLFESQTASAVLAAGILIFLWSIDPQQTFHWGWFQTVSIQKYFQSFSRGLISSEGVLFFLSGTVFFLFLTFRALEKRSFRNPL